MKFTIWTWPGFPVEFGTKPGLLRGIANWYKGEAPGIIRKP